MFVARKQGNSCGTRVPDLVDSFYLRPNIINRSVFVCGLMLFIDLTCCGRFVPVLQLPQSPLGRLGGGGLGLLNTY